MRRMITTTFLLASMVMACLICWAEPVVDEGQAAITPWSGYWWPFHQGGLTGPLRKYDRLTGRKAAHWEEQEGRADPQAPRWHGYCHAQTAAAIMESEPRKGGVLRRDGGGQEIPISIADQKGWLAACHTADVAEVHGDRFGDEEGPEDPQDLAPDRLWHLCQLYLRERGVPFALDIEPGPEVWNYPVFRYRVEHEPADQPGLRIARMTFWLADTAVPPDYVGIQIRKCTYLFSFRLEEGAVVAGSGRWIGPSREDHPDFAWYPYIAEAENPEVDYQMVKTLLTRVGSAGGGPQPPSQPPDPGRHGRRPEPSPSGGPSGERDGGGRPPAGPGGSGTPGRPGSPEPQPPGGGQETTQEEIVLSPQELLALVTSRTSSFKFDVSLDRFDGAAYQPGETFSVSGATAEPGYIYVFLVNPRNELLLLYPQVGQDNFVKGEVKLPKELDVRAFRVPEEVGVYRLKFVITSKPIRMAGLMAHKDRGDGQQSKAGKESPDASSVRYVKGQTFEWHPAGKKLMREVLASYAEGQQASLQLDKFAVERIIGRFAQDEAAFYVPGPLPKTPEKP